MFLNVWKLLTQAHTYTQRTEVATRKFYIYVPVMGVQGYNIKVANIIKKDLEKD